MLFRGFLLLKICAWDTLHFYVFTATCPAEGNGVAGEKHLNKLTKELIISHTKSGCSGVLFWFVVLKQIGEK